MTTTRPDLYAILGVPPVATQAQISHAYRGLLRQHHPDTRSPADEPQGILNDQALQQILAAYRVLKDPTLRADYDRQIRSDIDRVARPPREPLNRYRTYLQPPIVAGPVHWRRAPDPPHR